MAGTRKRGRRGDGSIQEIAKGKKYRVRIDYGTDARGKRLRRTETVRGTYSDAKARLDEMKDERDNGLRLDGAKTTFEEFARDFMQQRRTFGNCEKRTLRQSESVIGILCAYLGAYRLEQIDAALIERTLATIKRERGITNRTLQAYRTQLNLVLGKACRYGYIIKNPCADVERPKPEKSTARALGQNEIDRLVSSLESDWTALVGGTIARMLEPSPTGEGRVHIVGLCRVGVVIALYLEFLSGLRGEEAFSLTWGKLDFERATMLVDAALDDGATLKGTKNATSTRTIPLPACMFGKLREWKELQRHELERLGIEQTGETPVCCSNVGGFLDDHNKNKYCREFFRAHGLDVKPHWLRHTWATLHVRNGADIKTVMALGGWSSPDILLEIYAHETEGGKREAADKLESAVFGSLGTGGEMGENVPQTAAV